MRDATDSRFLMTARAKVMPRSQSFDEAVASRLPCLPARAGKAKRAVVRHRRVILRSPVFSCNRALRIRWLCQNRAKA